MLGDRHGAALPLKKPSDLLTYLPLGLDHWREIKVVVSQLFQTQIELSISLESNTDMEQRSDHRDRRCRSYYSRRENAN